MALDLTDYSSNSNDITTNSGVTEHTATEAFSGSGSSADIGSGDYMTVPTHSSLDFSGTESVTQEAWVKMDASAPDGDHNITMKGGTGDFKGNYRLIVRIASGTCYVFFQYYGSNNGWHNYNASTGGFARGAWHHVAARYTGGTAASIKCYVDGSGVTGSWTYGNGTANLATQGDDLLLGSAGANVFVGLADEIRIWRDYRTDGEISGAYDSQLVGDETGLEAYYSFNSLGGATAVPTRGLLGVGT